MLPLLASAQLSKRTNHVYIWDVTQSMKGYNNAQNIYDDVVDVMVNSLQNIEADGSYIYIIPFKDKVLETFKRKATTTGINEAINYVKSFENNDITYTNVCAAWEHTFNLLDRNNKNIVYLLTDGEQSDLSKRNPRYGKSCMDRVIAEYCKLVERDENSYTFYISLNTKLPAALKNKFANSCPEYLRLIEGQPPSQIINIQPTTQMQIVNLNDEKLTFTQYFDIDGNLPESFKYNAILNLSEIKSYANVPIKIAANQGKTIVNGQTEFEILISKNDKEKLKSVLPEESAAIIYFTKQDLAKLGLSDHIIEFAPDRIKLLIRNKKEKILRIKIVDE